MNGVKILHIGHHRERVLMMVMLLSLIKNHKNKKKRKMKSQIK